MQLSWIKNMRYMARKKISNKVSYFQVIKSSVNTLTSNNKQKKTEENTLENRNHMQKHLKLLNFEY